jgi:predicted nucleic acid-binding Zn ribbon protein
MQCDAVCCSRIYAYVSEVTTDYFFRGRGAFSYSEMDAALCSESCNKTLKAKRNRLPDVRFRACNVIHLRSEFILAIASHSVNIQI